MLSRCAILSHSQKYWQWASLRVPFLGPFVLLSTVDEVRAHTQIEFFVSTVLFVCGSRCSWLFVCGIPAPPQSCFIVAVTGQYSQPAPANTLSQPLGQPCSPPHNLRPLQRHFLAAKYACHVARMLCFAAVLTSALRVFGRKAAIGESGA